MSQVFNHMGDATRLIMCRACYQKVFHVEFKIIESGKLHICQNYHNNDSQHINKFIWQWLDIPQCTPPEKIEYLKENLIY